MKMLKDAGIRDVRAIRSRANRALAMRRIGREDHDAIADLCDKLEARITSMEEVDPQRKEFG